MIVAAAFFAASAARAADYPQPPPPPPPIYIPPPPIEEFSGWYLRGDIGFSNQSVGSLFNANYGGYDSVQNVNKSFDAAPLFGIGVGYYFNNWLRFDVTGEYRGNANFHGLDIGHLGAASSPDRYTASKSELTFLFNGYVDIGTWNNLTPFVGAGVGMSRNTISNFGDVSICTIPGCTTSDASAATASKWNFAWALYAGLGYKVTKNVTIEFSYRYIDLGDAETGTLIGYDGTLCSCSPNPMQFKHLTSNDFRLGVRFNLDAFYEAPRPVQYYTPPPQYYAPPPVYTPPPVYAPPPPLRSKG
jgi:opacity protein-like surface antigen